MNNKLVVKPPDFRAPRVASDLAWFAGSAATAFGVVDLFHTGSMSTILHMLATTEGRVICIVTGGIGLVFGRVLEARRAA